MNDRPDPELEQLRDQRAALEREVERLRAALAASERTAARRDEAQAAERLGHAGRLAASEARTSAAEVDARAAWARAAELGTSLGRRIAEGQTRLIASQAAVASLERANEGLAAGHAAIALREADLRAVIESAIDCAIITTSRDGLVLAWNDGARRLLGWDEGSAMTMRFDAVLPPAERESGVLAAEIAVALSGARVSREGWLLRQDGTAVWAGIEAMALNGDGVDEPVGVLWMLRDRQEAHRAELALRTSEERYRMLFAAIDEGFAVFDMIFDADGRPVDFRYVETNPAFEAQMGRRPSPGQTMREVFPEARDMWLELYATVARTGRSERFVDFVEGLDRWYDIYVFPAGEPGQHRLAALFADVTERKTAEDALRESETLRRIALEGGRMGAWRWDCRERMVQADATFLALWGIAPSNGQVPVSAFTDLMGAEDAASIEAVMARDHAPGEGFDGEVQVAAGPFAGHWVRWRGQADQDRPWVLNGISFDVTAARLASERLRASEARLRKVLDIETVAVVYFDFVGGIQDANDAFLKMIGSTRAELEAGEVRYERLTPPEWRWRDDATIAELRSGGRSGPFEKQYVRKDGSRIWILCAATALDDRTAAEFIIDITDRRLADAALRESEARFRGFAENSADVLWIANRDGTGLEYLSPAFERIFGEPPDRVMADIGRFRELVHPDDREAVLGFMPRAVAGETAIAHYRVIRPSDGRIVHLRDTGFPIRSPDGAVIRVAGIVQDISDLHEGAAAREAEKERFRTLAEGIPNLVWRSAPHGRWTWASPQWEVFTGLSSEASRDAGWAGALHPSDREGARAAWETAESIGLYQADFRLRHAGSGRYAWFQTRALPFRDVDGGLEWIGACTNIDDQIRAREALARNAEELERRVQERTDALMAVEATLRQSQKLEAIGQLTGGIAHDFNNMLQGVSGALAMAQRRLAEGRAADVARYMQVAGDAAARAAGLTRRLLAFARRQRLDPRRVDPDALVGGMGDLLRRTMGPAIEVALDLRDGALHVLCDPSELEGAVLNLCINARDAMPNGGRLIISIDDIRLSAADIARHEEAVPGDYISIRIEDTGTGMTPEVLEHVLEPFFTTKPQGEGTGLGLSQVHGFVRQTGGVLRIASAPGRGTTVQILLPRAPDQADIGSPDAMAPTEIRRADHGETVLMVDDETAVRGPAAERLRDLGYRVVEASDGPTALHILDGGLRPDVLVTDVGLPNGMDGRMVTDEVRRRIPDLPVVFVTGYARVALPDDAVVVTKPFDLDVLARRLDELRVRTR